MIIIYITLLVFFSTILLTKKHFKKYRIVIGLIGFSSVAILNMNLAIISKDLLLFTLNLFIFLFDLNGIKNTIWSND